MDVSFAGTATRRLFPSIGVSGQGARMGAGAGVGVEVTEGAGAGARVGVGAGAGAGDRKGVDFCFWHGMCTLSASWS